MPEPVPLLDESYGCDKFLLPAKPNPAPLSIVETTKDDDKQLNELISQYIVNDDPTDSKEPSEFKEIDSKNHGTFPAEAITEQEHEEPVDNIESAKKTSKKTAPIGKNNTEKECSDNPKNKKKNRDSKEEKKKDKSDSSEESEKSSSSETSSDKVEEDSESKEENEYKVEAIIGHAWKGGEKRYVVKWKGYSSRHNTIEPIENLYNCKLLIDSYERSLIPKRLSAQVANKVISKKLKLTRHSPRVQSKDLIESSTEVETSGSEESSSSSDEYEKKKSRKAENKKELAKQALQLIKARWAAKERSPALSAIAQKKSIVTEEKGADFQSLKTNGPSLSLNLSKNATPLGSKANGGKNFKSIFPRLNGANRKNENAPTKIPKKEIKAKDQSLSPLPIYIQEESGMNGRKQEEIEEEEVEVEQAKPMESDVETQIEEEVFDPFEDARKLKEYLEGMEAFKAKLSGLSGAPVTVVNEQDMCAPPADFSFIQIYKGIHFDVLTSTSKDGCACGNGVCISSICKCNLKHGKKKHRESDLKPLYECNANCPCGAFCPNRSIQREGRTVPLEIFRTKKKGWGLKAMRDVMQDEFIDRYVGEVLTPKQADERPNTTYQFDLDYCYGPDEQGDYVVDAQFIGGPCRFMNHSCDPNCYVRPMFIWGRDEKLPEIGFFAKRDIKAGEELTFDYFCDQKTKGTYRCACGAPQCKGYLFS